MQRRFFVHACKRCNYASIAALGLCAMTLLPADSAHADRALADRANEAARSTQPSPTVRGSEPSDYQPVFHINYLRREEAKDCQVPLPPVGAISPFPLALRLGAMVSPRLKFDGGIDATLRGVHLFPGFTTRIDADAIVSANFGGVTTIVPITFDQIYSLNLPVSSRVYVGGGIGPYFGDVTRFGGKLIVGAEFSRIGLEGNLHFSGQGDPLFTIQARIGL
jgi:hypothetical protein